MSLLDKTNLLITPNAVKAGKLYSVIPSNGTGDCTVVRNTTATYFNSSIILVTASANVPRINYLTVGGIPLILDEPQATNLQTFSEDFSNAIYLNEGVTNALTSVINPRNTNSVYKISENTINTFHRLRINVSLTGDYYFSIFIKADGRNFFYIRTSSSSGTFNTGFNLLNGTVSFDGNADAKIEAFPNGYFRCSVKTSNSTGISPSLSNAVVLNNNIVQYLGDGASGFYFFGAQLELNKLTSYIATNTAAVTRNADVITVAPPAGTVKITTTFSNDTTQVLTTIPALFTVPEGLIKQVLMQSSL